MRLFCDIDGVLVPKTGDDNYHTKPWNEDGKILWEFIKPLSPTILTMLPDNLMQRYGPQKRAWCDRELGTDVPLLIALESTGKGVYARPDTILIDDLPKRHSDDWTRAGGIFLHHKSAVETIRQVQKLLRFHNSYGRELTK